MKILLKKYLQISWTIHGTHNEKTHHWKTQFPNEHIIGLSHESAFPKKYINNWIKATYQLLVLDLVEMEALCTVMVQTVLHFQDSF